MTDIPLSAVAWLSVVLIQAVVHFFVLGHRRNRREPNDALPLDESLSLAETLSLSDALDDSASVTASVHSCPDNSYQVPLSPMYETSSQQFLAEHGGEINITLLGKTLISERVHDDNETSQEFIDFLNHTGTELLKTRSVECLVEEQMRAQ
ncbi:unnamed protein product [Cylindrotheca closterium]|uniref:Uncharacterized protein n=1 Tax=Cylindrotheca closterium TaxID=2856 RepID=A0AAD2PXZ2_9STRA|nr:unnamed protein product [Cylindrotheca closterium]CAJ1969100.1 unnamed protein product [Cylindrotheca closterium]